MSPRLFIFLDEWLWIGLCLYLLHMSRRQLPSGVFDTPAPNPDWKLYRRTFFAVLVAGAVMIYGLAYPGLWGWW